MAKDKKGSKAATSAPLPAVSKPLEAVKAGRVTKAIENPKAVAQEAAKKAKKEVEKVSKKAKKDPTPESSDEEADDTSESSASSDDQKDQDSGSDSDSGSGSDSSGGSDSEEDVAPKKVDGPKINGNAKAGSGSDDSSSGSDSDDEPAPKVNGKAKAASDSGEGSGSDGSSDNSSSASDSDSDSDSGSDSDSEVDAKAGAEKLGAVGAAKADAADSSDASSSSDESDEETVPVKIEEAPKKRKAQDSIDQTPKKTKVVIDGEEREAVANLFVGNLSWNVDEEWLTREFEEFGELSGVRVITDRESGRSKGFGYVEFTQVDSAARALEAKNGEFLDGRNIRVDFSLPRPQKSDGFTPQQRSFDRAQRYGDTPKEPSKTLFVGNVSFDADESMLTEVFGEYGTLSAVRLPTDKNTNQMKGFGYVEFTSIDEAKAAFDGLQGAEISGRPVRLDFASERSNDSPGGGRGRGTPRGRGGFSDRGGRGGFSDRGGRGGFNDRGRGRGGPRGGRGNTTNRGGFGDFSGKKIAF